MRAILLTMTLALAIPGTTRADASTPAPAAVTGQVELGSVEVNGIKDTVRVLEDMKLAVKRPFSNDPAHYDDMVCIFKEQDGYRAQGEILECGTQGYFNMRRTVMGRDMNVSADPQLSTTPTLGHPWHVQRLLDHKQLAVLRHLLGVLPEPGKGDVLVVDDLHGESAPAAASTPAPPGRRR